MKECRIINVHDGKPERITEQPFYTVTEYFREEKEINELLKEGWEVKSATPHYSPNMLEEGCWSFFLDGMTFYLEREVEEAPEPEKETEKYEEDYEYMTEDYYEDDDDFGFIDEEDEK